MEQLRRRFPHVLVLTFEPDGTEGDGGTYRSRVKGRDDLAVAAEFVRHVRSSAVTDGERDLLVAAFDAARRAEGED
jgi:exonuclease SbcD